METNVTANAAYSGVHFVVASKYIKSDFVWEIEIYVSEAFFGIY